MVERYNLATLADNFYLKRAALWSDQPSTPITFSPPSWFNRSGALIAERGWPIASAPLRAGDATCHAGGTLHGAGANRAGRVREVLTVIYYAAGTRAAEPANPNQRTSMPSSPAFAPATRPGAR